MRDAMRNVALILVLGSTVACTTIERHYYSRPEVPGGIYYTEEYRPAGLVRVPRDGGNTVHVVVDGLRISLRTENVAARVYSAGPRYLPVIPWSGLFTMFGSDPEPPHSFRFRVSLKPQDPASAEWSCDAKQIRVRSDGGPWLQPVRHQRFRSGAYHSVEQSFTVDDDDSVFMAFDTSGNASHTFTVKIDGIARNGVPIDVPLFTLVRESKLGFHFYPP